MWGDLYNLFRHEFWLVTILSNVFSNCWGMLDWIILKVEIYILTYKLFCIVTWLVRGHWRIELKVFIISVLL